MCEYSSDKAEKLNILYYSYSIYIVMYIISNSRKSISPFKLVKSLVVDVNDVWCFLLA